MNTRFYFQGPVLNAGPIFIYIVILFWTEYLFQPNLLFFANVQPNLLADLNGVVWFGFYMLWGGLDWYGSLPYTVLTQRAGS